MSRPCLVIQPSREETRLLLHDWSRELLRAVLPSAGAAAPGAAPRLLEGLSLWLGRPLWCALRADAEGSSSALGLCDGFGIGVTTAHYEVEVLGRQRMAGLGRFADLRAVLQRGMR